MSDAFTSDTYDALCKEAEDHLSRGLAEQARELLLKAISLIGTRPKARSLLADCCMSLGLWSEARAQLETLTTLEVGNPSHHFRLGQVMEEMGEFALARDNYSVVIEKDPDNHAAEVALNRLKDRPDKEPQETAEEEDQPGEQTVRQSGDVQMYPDDDSEEGVFASSSEEEVEKLLKDIGVGSEDGSGEDGTDVAELLSSMGIDLGEKKKESKEPVQDISSILGGGQEESEAEEEPEEPSGEGAPDETEEGRDEGPSLDAIFGGPPEKSETAEAEKDEEEEEETVAAQPETEEGEGAPPLEAIFGESEGEEPEQKTEDETAEEEPSEEEAGTSLEAIFGGGPSEEEGEETEAAEEGEEPEEPPADGGEPAAEETAEEAAEEEEPPSEKEDKPSLASIFGGGPSGTEQEKEEPAEEEEEDQAPEEEAVAEEKGGPSLASIFGGGPSEEEGPEEAEAEEEQPAEEEEVPEKAEAGEEEPAGEEEVPEEAEADEGEPAEEEEVPEEAEADEGEPAGEEEVPEETEADEGEPAGTGPKETEAAVLCHRPAPESVAVVYLEGAEVMVAPAFLAAADGDLAAEAGDEHILMAGSGRVWIGDGSSVPVTLNTSKVHLLRRERTALCESSVELSDSDENGLSKAAGNGTVLLLADGRFRWISVNAGDTMVRIARESLMAVEGDVKLQPDEDLEDGFLLASGEGRLLISG